MDAIFASKKNKFAVSKKNNHLLNACVEYDIEPIVGLVISNKLATLHELQTIYSYDELLLLADIVITDNYNKMKVQEEQERCNQYKR